MRRAVARRRSRSRTPPSSRRADVSPMTCPTALLRHCATPPLVFPKRVAFGAALRGGCAATHLRQQQTLRFLPVKQDNNIQNLPVTLQTISIQSPIRSLISGASLRDRATLPSPLRGLDPSGGYPSRLRSLRSLRGPLARRFAPLTAACLAAAAVHYSGASVLPAPSPLRAGAMRLALRRRSHSRTPSGSRSRRVSCAHSPRRLAFGSGPGTAFPFVRYPGSDLSYALRRLGSHTGRTDGARRCMRVPEIPLECA